MPVSPNLPIRVAFVAHDLLVNLDGGRAYALEVLRYLKRSGCQIEFVCTNTAPGMTKLWYRVDPELGEVARVTLPYTLGVGGFRISWRVMTRRLFLMAAEVYARVLPESLKQVYRRRVKAKIAPSPDTDPEVLEPLRWIGSVVSTHEILFAKHRIRKTRPDVVIANYVWMSDALQAAPPEALTLVLTYDVLHLRTASFQAAGLRADGAGAAGDSGHANWDRDTEAGLLGQAKAVIAIQPEEARVLREMVPHREVITVAMPVLPRRCLAAQVEGRCLFVGSPAQHNVHGLTWFLRDVWPLVLGRQPDAELHVCGDICARLEGDFPRVRFVGRLPDLNPEYSAAQVCVVPNSAGSGLKIKMVEALSYGRACVSTSTGLQGLMDVADRAVLRADTPQEFATAVCRVLGSGELRREMESEARRYVEEHLSPDVVCRPLGEYLHSRRSGRVETAPPSAVRSG